MIEFSFWKVKNDGGDRRLVICSYRMYKRDRQSDRQDYDSV